LLEKSNQQPVGEYITIGRQRGTLQFSDMLYDPDATDVKYDTIKYDGSPYDAWPYRELRLILETLRDHIFIDDLLIEYNDLFFASIRYVLSEQSSVDWLFKTSFIKVKHYSGKLSQRKSYAPSNAADYEKYIREVKPYKTKIREYVTGYTADDSAVVQCTDFDLTPVYSSSAGEILPQTVIFSNEQWQQTNAYIDQYPHRNWFDTVGYGVSSIELIDSGQGYTVPPQVEIIGGHGTGATAQAVLGSGGRISEIRIITQGQGYLATPDVNFITTDSVTPATAVAVLGNGVARTVKTSIRLDRVGKRIVYDDLDIVQEFTTDIEQSVFVLKWPIHLDKKTIHIDIDGQEIIHSYSYENVVDQSKSYTRRVGVITLDFVVKPNSNVTISYRRNISLLSAVDRVASYYNPTSGQYANDVSQLTVQFLGCLPNGINMQLTH